MIWAELLVQKQPLQFDGKFFCGYLLFSKYSRAVLVLFFWLMMQLLVYLS